MELDTLGFPKPQLSRWPWLQRLLETSEANACLSLCGNHASTLSADAVGVTVECRIRCQDGFPLGPTLIFEAVGVFGDDAGRAIAFRPLHDPSRLVVAFRGVRVEREALKSHAAQPVRSRNRSMGSAVSDRGIDIKNMLGTQCASADWLPALDMRVHDGVMRHHDSFWTSRHTSRNERKSTQVATRICRKRHEPGNWMRARFGGRLLALIPVCGRRDATPRLVLHCSRNELARGQLYIFTSMYMNLYQYLYLDINCIYLYSDPCIHVSISMFLPIYLSIYLYLSLIYLSIYLSIHLSIYSSLYP